MVKADWKPEITEFRNLQMVKNRGQQYFVISDSTGHMTTLVKNLRLKNRVFTEHADIRALDVFS